MIKNKCVPNSCCKPVSGLPPCNCRFLSSYIEAVGDEQIVASGADIVFDISADYLDNVGNNITVSADGTTFTINTPGLYHIEWSLNISAEDPIVLIGLLENGEPFSAIYNSSLEGNTSSGALINVVTVPYTISLHNFGNPISLVKPDQYENVSASIRILRFADGPTL